MNTATDQLPLSKVNASLLEKWCRDFLHSEYYLKAIQDASYARMEAIADFLQHSIPAAELALPAGEDLQEIALYIRKNYYRYF